MKKWKYLLVFSVIVCLSAGLAAFFSIVNITNETRVIIDTPDSVVEGTEFIASVDISDVTNFNAANYDVNYNPAVLAVTDVTGGVIGTTTIPVDSWGIITPGTIRIIDNVPEIIGVSGSGYIAEVHFHVIGLARSSSKINLSNGVLSDNSANEILATWKGVSVRIIPLN